MSMLPHIVNGEAESHTSGPYKVQVLDRAVGILELLSKTEEEMSLGELTAAIGLHKSTVHRLLMVLEGHGLVERSSLHGRYRLGLRLFELGSTAVANLRLRDSARPRMVRLANEVQETIHLSVLDHGSAICIDQIEPERSVRMTFHIGNRFAAHATASGKAILAHLPESALQEYLHAYTLRSFTRKTIIDAEQLAAELNQARELGYAVSDGEADLEVTSVAVPVFGRHGEVLASLGATGPIYRMARERIPSLGERLRSMAAELSAQLNGSTAEKAAC
ncbi:MAG: IclR family transcriptional regulator [Acidobacteriota bacterium]|nr:IclR family transcriptional regulator [Acidobacteriota bacterium]